MAEFTIGIVAAGIPAIIYLLHTIILEIRGINLYGQCRPTNGKEPNVPVPTT